MQSQFLLHKIFRVHPTLEVDFSPSLSAVRCFTSKSKESLLNPVVSNPATVFCLKSTIQYVSYEIQTKFRTAY
jgi:hypothetical protein